MKAGCLRGVFYGMEEDMAMLAGRVLTTALILVFWLGGTAGAHFGMVIPSDNMVMQADARSIGLDAEFFPPHGNGRHAAGQTQSVYRAGQR